MPDPLRILYLEDDLQDRELVEAILVEGGISHKIRYAGTRESFVNAIDEEEFDIILADYTLPAFDGLAALEIANQKRPLAPFIFVTGTMGEETAIETLKRGATDYVLKQNLSRLVPVVRRAIEETKIKKKLIAKERTLQDLESKYRLIVESVDEGIFIAQDDVIKFPNPKSLEMCGYSREELTDLSIADLVHPEDREKVLERYADRLRGRIFDEKLPFRVHRKTGGDIWAQIIPKQIIWEGKPGVLCILRDITKERSLEAQIRQSQKVEAIGRLAGGVAHDFNNLLTVIIGYCELMEIKIGEENPLWGDVEEIRKSADRAAGLTRQLLAFSRRQILQPKVLEIDELIPDMEKMFRRVIGEDVNLVTILGADAGKVKADPSQIEQVIINLVINSRDAMPDGGCITIETTTAELDEAYVRTHGGAWPGPHVMLAVSDTGCGMDPETLSKAFDPFFTTKEKGTGLGLSTVYGIVKQSGGCLYAYSEPGRGTTMKIYLPRVTGETATKEEKRDTGFEDRLHGSETILIVEDDETLRKLATSILEGYGYTIMAAGNGEEALQLLNDSRPPPRLLITDVVMPKMGGRELSGRLKAIHPDIRVLFMSGYTDNAIVHQGVLDAGVSFLPKPFTPKALARKVREVLDKA